MQRFKNGCCCAFKQGALLAPMLVASVAPKDITSAADAICYV
jgi:hypothetical protein